MADKRESGRIRDGQMKRVLDDAARMRRQRKTLESLEEDNFQEDPHADLRMSKRAPKFEECASESGPTKIKRRKSKTDQLKFRVKRNFSSLLEEEQSMNLSFPNYLSAVVPPSKFPDRKFCSVCGFPSNYVCVQCGSRYCCVKCLGTHQDTRCLKWIS